MTALQQQQLTHLEQLLQARDTTLRSDIRSEIDTSDNYQQLASEAPDTGDAANAALYVDLGHAAISRDVEELRNIEAARQRLREGTYGQCLECALDIPYERLQVQPTAERCTPCQDQYEKTHAIAGRPTSL